MALDKRLVAQYNRLYPKWEAAHARYWDANASRPFVTSGGRSPLNLAQQARMTPNAKVGPFGGPDFRRRVRGEEFKSNKALRNAIEAMKRETSKSYTRERQARQKQWMVRRIEAFGDAELTAVAEELSLEEIERLYDFEDFGDILNSSVAIQDSDPLLMIDPLVEDQIIDSLRQRVMAAKGGFSKAAQKRIAKKVRAADREAQRARKRAEYAEAEQQHRAEVTAYNIRMARKGREWLERYGLQSTFGAEAAMTREEWVASYAKYWA